MGVPNCYGSPEIDGCPELLRIAMGVPNCSFRIAPLKTLRKLTRVAGSEPIDAGMASLAVRHGETYQFNHANRNEVYLADVGRGTSVAVFGPTK